jgi:hypothetical protein
MLGDEKATSKTKISASNMVPRTYFEREYCKNKTVSYIKFHPTKDHPVAMSLIEYMSFDDRVEVLGKSFESYVLATHTSSP